MRAPADVCPHCAHCSVTTGRQLPSTYAPEWQLSAYHRHPLSHLNGRTADLQALLAHNVPTAEQVQRHLDNHRRRLVWLLLWLLGGLKQELVLAVRGPAVAVAPA